MLVLLSSLPIVDSSGSRLSPQRLHSRRQNSEADLCSSRTPPLSFVGLVLRAVSCREELSNLSRYMGCFVAGSQPHPLDREMRTPEETSRATGERKEVFWLPDIHCRADHRPKFNLCNLKTAYSTSYLFEERRAFV